MNKPLRFKWDEEAINILREYYPFYNFDKINELLGNSISKPAIVSKANKLGIKGNKYWTEDQLEEFKKRYPLEGASLEMCKTFQRTKENLWALAGQIGIISNRKDTGDSHPCFLGYKEVSQSYINNLKRAAEKRNIEFLITPSDIYNKYINQDKKCFYSGREISFVNKTASTDRINSKLGYTNDNIQIVHKFVNSSKMDDSNLEYLEWVSIIYKFNEN